MKKQKENSHNGITCSDMRKQNVQAKKVYEGAKVPSLKAVLIVGSSSES